MLLIIATATAARAALLRTFPGQPQQNGTVCPQVGLYRRAESFSVTNHNRSREHCTDGVCDE